MQIGGSPFGQLTQLGRDMFDKFKQGKGLDETLTGNAASPALTSKSNPAVLLPDLGNEAGGLDKGQAISTAADAKAADPVEAAFELLERDLTGMMGMLGYGEQSAKDAAKALTDAARDAYSQGKAFSFSQVAIETAEHYQKGPNGSAYLGTLAAQSLELYVDPATGTFAAKAVSVEIKAAQVETTQPVDFSKWRDSQDALMGALDLGSPLEGAQSMTEMLLEKMRELAKALEAKRLEDAKALEAQQAEGVLSALPGASQLAPSPFASQLLPKDMQDIGSKTDKGLLALRLDALVPVFGRPPQADEARQGEAAKPDGLNVVA